MIILFIQMFVNYIKGEREMEKDVNLLRELASQYAEFANDPINQERMKLHRAVNDKKMIRPVVLIEEIPWHEMNIDGELTIQCQDEDYRKAEKFFRREIYKWKHLQTDMILRPFYGVDKIIEHSGIGIEIKEETLGGEEGSISSHRYIAQLKNEDDLEKLHNDCVVYKEKETVALCQKIAAAIADILPVKIYVNEEKCLTSFTPWDDIARYMGPQDVLYGLVDEPEFMHKIVTKLTDIYLDRIKQYEKRNLLQPNQLHIHKVSAMNSDLCRNIDYNHVKASNVWGRGAAQFFATVSKEMREEFDIQYMKRAMAPFGLVYYGCCEPLHNMIDLVSQIPNLRKISVTPWADVDIAADQIGSDYVMACKPNPAYVTDFKLYEDSIRKEIKRMINASRRNHTSMDIVLKDISTVGRKPDNLFRWEQLVMEMVRQ